MSDQLPSDPLPALYDAYASPPVTAEALPPRGAVLGRLKTLCIIAIILGSLGLLGCLRDAAGLLLSGKAQPQFKFAGQAEGGREVQELGEAMQAQAQELDARFRPVNAVLVPLHLIVSALLLAGGVLALQLRPRGRSLLTLGCGLTIPFIVVAAGLQTVLKIQAANLALEYMPQMMEAQGGVPGQAVQIGMAVGKAVMVGIIAISWLWVLAQVIFYGITIRHLRRPAVQELFPSQPWP